MIRYVEETGSTNADYAEALRSGADWAREGVWHVAKRQTAGRGRQGREWFDGSGNFMGSTCVALAPDDPPPASLSFVTALAVYDIVEEALAGAARPEVKWPNDVLIGSAKMSGILLERSGGSVVVGVGVNLAKAPDLPDRKTAAISVFAPRPDLEWFAGRLAERFAKRLANWREQGLSQTLEDFAASSIHEPGSAVSVHDQDGSRINGYFDGLDKTDGALRLRLADGSQRVIRAGDII